jgi:hypothetical protein
VPPVDRAVHATSTLDKGQAYKRQTHPLVREDVTQGLWQQWFSWKEKDCGREPQMTWLQYVLIGDKLVLSLSLHSSADPWLDLGRYFSLYTVGRTTWTEDQPVARSISTHRTTQTQNKRTQISMPRVGFERMTPLLELAKIVHARPLWSAYWR